MRGRTAAELPRVLRPCMRPPAGSRPSPKHLWIEGGDGDLRVPCRLAPADGLNACLPCDPSNMPSEPPTDASRQRLHKLEALRRKALPLQSLQPSPASPRRIAAGSWPAAMRQGSSAPAGGVQGAPVPAAKPAAAAASETTRQEALAQNARLEASVIGAMLRGDACWMPATEACNRQACCDLSLRPTAPLQGANRQLRERLADALEELEAAHAQLRILGSLQQQLEDATPGAADLAAAALEQERALQAARDAKVLQLLRAKASRGGGWGGRGGDGRRGWPDRRRAGRGGRCKQVRHATGQQPPSPSAQLAPHAAPSSPLPCPTAGRGD